MKIDSFINAYSRISQSGKEAAKTHPEKQIASSRSKTDVAEFSSSQNVFSDKSLVGAKSRIHHDISLGASPERLEALRNDIRAGTYRVSTEQIVSSILGGE
ncbi:hypothetical protein U6B65_10145 [Oscillospiraceae bacterium MB08-C2-2]|nr:hypothetical protein U6B65_10145 [Oscillospiraceae bacterium MB08-C2-2]